MHAQDWSKFSSDFLAAELRWIMVPMDLYHVLALLPARETLSTAKGGTTTTPQHITFTLDEVSADQDVHHTVC